MIKNNIAKIALVAGIALAASPVLASVAFGYGGGGGGGGGGAIITGGGSANPLPGQTTGVITTPVTTPVGQVLGASTFNFTQNLWFKMPRNNDVMQLQQFLVAEGYSIPDAATTYFGPETFAAVKQFQAAHNLPVTGYVGPLTRAIINQGIVPITE